MPRIRKWILLGLLLSAPLLLAQTTSTHPHHKSRKHVKPLVLPPLPSGPLRQLPMDQLPPSPANVSFEGGLLTISSQNSTLFDILRDVRQLTGASIDIPPGPGMNERVIAHLGPGAPRDVLVGLLNGTSFNYVILGTNSDPTAVSSLVLTSKPLSGGEVQTAANVYQNNVNPEPARFIPPGPFRPGMTIAPPQPGGAQPVPTTEEDAKDDEENADDNTDDQAQPGQPDTGAAVMNQQPDPNQPNAGPKTPEQILEMLRRQQQPQIGPVMGNPGGQQPPQ